MCDMNFQAKTLPGVQEFTMHVQCICLQLHCKVHQAVHVFATANVPVQGKEDTKANARYVSASVFEQRQFGSMAQARLQLQ